MSYYGTKVDTQETTYPIDSYQDLQNAIIEWADRDDSEFVNQVPNFIDFAQKEIYRTARFVFTSKEAYLKVVNGQANIPTDWISSEYLIFANGWKNVRETSLQEVQYAKRKGETLENCNEVIFCRTGQRFLFTPEFDANLPDDDGSLDGTQLVLGYFFDPNKLSGDVDNDAKYLLMVAPDLLLYTALKHACTFIQDADGENAFTAKANATRKQMEEQNKLQDYKASPKAVASVNPRNFW